ncbi:GntR family transcriptional regulator [Nitratireductor thuwali]|uniref:HTH-type transcriptional repressor RspR n=1 Tax=Nitratireductor thuwali TaxID=2267699 RepID=A0ABY5MJI0_9HYPH|nr:HTH-type transcriptional repressor RspR [Nitratireductor thuwali]
MKGHDIAVIAENEAFPGSSPAQGIKRVSASQQIHHALRERIISLDLAPGQHLSRSEIAQHYGVSQTPVRDAMLKLEEEGLLVIRPQSKTEVSKIDVEHARESQFLRLAIEVEVTRRLALCGARREIIATARKVLALQDSAFEAGELERFARLDRVFHQSLCEAAGVADLWQLVTARSGHIDRLRNLNLPEPGKPASILVCHHRILEGIERGDLAATEASVREHLSGTLGTVDQIRARYPEYF